MQPTPLLLFVTEGGHASLNNVIVSLQGGFYMPIYHPVSICKEVHCCHDNFQSIVLSKESEKHNATCASISWSSTYSSADTGVSLKKASCFGLTSQYFFPLFQCDFI